eukprot:CAMPEP_0170191992 /NCGR_PEP_ID=MMETSP0040_2-20121228/53055_1 /TAXON_ID=641309 /ORGANISM="Lotharella oceanica, Strain CCMP622" /LENGTH=265 /DNA_ID=CAMNT_0010440227 /DNA_START=29 /DNA_END=826 /DNA_ORIENTATION=+
MPARRTVVTTPLLANKATGLSRPAFKQPRPGFFFRSPNGPRKSTRLSLARRSIVSQEKNLPSWVMRAPNGQRASQRLHCLREGLPSGLPSARGLHTSAPIAREMPTADRQRNIVAGQLKPEAKSQAVLSTKTHEPFFATPALKPVFKRQPLTRQMSDNSRSMAEVLFGSRPVNLPTTPRLAHKEMKKMFQGFANESESISRQGFKSAISSEGRRPKANAINSAFMGLDRDGSGTIDYEEFAEKVSRICIPNRTQSGPGALLCARG